MRTEIISEIDSYLRRLFPITRSITGQGNRETLRTLQEVVPIDIREIPTGTKVYDWEVPQEWNVKKAWIETIDGERIVDFDESNLHLVSYSEPVDRVMRWEELEPHIHYLEDLPEAIPYRTSYYHRTWGFCVNKHQYDLLKDSGRDLHVYIDSEFSDGSLTYGEFLIQGRREQEILISCYICHPSMANDSLSGVVLSAFLARKLASMNCNYSYRVVFVPETIGAIAYCSANEDAMKRIDMGLVITTTGGKGGFDCKQSWSKDHAINRHMEAVFSAEGMEFDLYPFDVHGSDERQYSSQGFRINCITISRDQYYRYPYYHTSLDDLDYVTAEQIYSSYDMYLKLIQRLEYDQLYCTTQPYCEIMLSKHGLYPALGGAMLPDQIESELDARLWLLFLCDGKTPLLDIAEKTSIPLDLLYRTSEEMVSKGVMQRVGF